MKSHPVIFTQGVDIMKILLYVLKFILVDTNSDRESSYIIYLTHLFPMLPFDSPVLKTSENLCAKIKTEH